MLVIKLVIFDNYKIDYKSVIEFFTGSAQNAGRFMSLKLRAVSYSRYVQYVVLF